MSRFKLDKFWKAAGFLGTYPARKLADAVAFIGQTSRLNTIAPPVSRRELSIFFTAFIPAALVVYYLLGKPHIPSEASWMAGIFTLACLLWATEALPLFATALLIIGLEILLLVNPAQWQGLGMPAGKTVEYTYFLQPLADPVVILFLGGFILARSSVKANVDNLIASVLLRPFLKNPSRLLLGIIAITAIFSMWMSNTATTALMLSLVMPLIAQMDDDKAFGRGLILAIPLAANLGGMGTPVASPPNAVAVGYLAKLGYTVHFTDWIIAAMPIMIIMLWMTWKLIGYFYPTIHPIKKFELPKSSISRWSNFVMFIFFVTVSLWLTEAFHGIPAPLIALIPVIAFTSTGLIDRADINSLEWNILLLIAGGIALGMGMRLTGLDQIIVSKIHTNPVMLVPVLIAAMILLSNFMSNTAASNLFIPIGIGMMQASGFGAIGILAGTLSLAIASSMAMALPVSTPPNALAYASGKLEAKDFRKTGIILGLFGFLLLTLLFILIGIAQRYGIIKSI